MERRIFILLLVFTITLADEAPSKMDILKALMPPSSQPLVSPQKTVVNQQTPHNVLIQNDQTQQLSGKLENALQQITPLSFPSINNYATDRCPPSNSYYSATKLLPILSTFLEFLDHSSEAAKAYSVCELIKNYLEGTPPSLEKNVFMDKLRLVEEHLLRIQGSANGDKAYLNFQRSPENKLSIVFHEELPGNNHQNCRETFGRLIQTAVNVYKETAKHPQCQPSGNVDENLYYPNNNVKPQKPYQFVVIYQNPPSSYYTPDYNGISILPNSGANSPHLDHLYPNLEVENPYGNTPNDGNIIQYLLPGGQNPNNPVLPLPQKEKPQYDVLALIRQYNLQHPDSPTNKNDFLDLLKKLTGAPSSDYNQPSVNNPDILQNNPSQSIVYGPVNPGSHFSHIYPHDPHYLPGVPYDQVQNYPDLVLQTPRVPTYPPPNNGYVPGAVYVEPKQPVNDPYHIYGEHSFPGAVTGDSQLNLNTQNNPELSLEILLGLLGRPERAKIQPGLNPQLENELWQYLHPNNVNPVKKNPELQLPNSPNLNQNYIVYGPNGVPVQYNLLDYLNQLQPDSNTGTYSDNVKPDYEALLRKLQLWLAVSNSNKLPKSQNKANVIELTYVLKRPKPLIYRPIYYVKYRLPYDSFIQNFQNLILKKPGLRSEPANLYQQLMSVTNISDVSPGLARFGKEEILRLVFGNGTLVDARVVDVPNSVLNQQLEATRKMNADLDPEVIEELSSNLGLNKSESDFNSDDAHSGLRSPQATSEQVEDLAVYGLATPSNIPVELAKAKISNSVDEGSTTFSNSDTAMPNYPPKVAPPIGSSKDWISEVANDHITNK